METLLSIAKPQFFFSPFFILLLCVNFFLEPTVFTTQYLLFQGYIVNSIEACRHVFFTVHRPKLVSKFLTGKKIARQYLLTYGTSL